MHAICVSVERGDAGQRLPSRNSSDAPPPVETWLISSRARLRRPPRPSRRRRRSSSRPASSRLAIASAIARVPSSNGGVSNTPIGPFQSTVFADAIARAYDSAVRGPMSSIASSAGIASRATACAALALLERRRDDRVVRQDQLVARACSSSSFAMLDAIRLDERLAGLEAHRLDRTCTPSRRR